MLPELLNIEFRNLFDLDLDYHPSETNQVTIIANKINDFIVSHKVECDKYLPKKQQIGTRSLSRALSEHHQAPDCENILAFYTIAKAYDVICAQNPLLEFDEYYKAKKIDLFSEHENILEVDLWRLPGDWNLYLTFDEIKYCLPAAVKYHGIDTPLTFEFLHIDDRIMKGTMEWGCVSAKAIPNEELWCNASSEDFSFSARLHLNQRIYSGRLLISGTGSFNMQVPRSNELGIFPTPVILEKTKSLGLKYEHKKRLDYFVPGMKSNLPDRLSSKDANHILDFMERRQSHYTIGLSPSNYESLANFNEKEKLDWKFDPPPQETRAYNKLKESLSGKWYSLSRLTKHSKNLSLTIYEFIPKDTKRNFLVKRYNYNKASNFRGFVDLKGDQLYLIFQERHDPPSRNRMVTFSMKGNHLDSIKTYLGIGLSVHERNTCAWRELLVRIDDAKEDYNPFDKFYVDDLSYQQFLDIDEKYIARNDKMYLSNRDQATLTFPNSEDSSLSLYLRQQGALPYCDKEYYIYAPYVYNQYDLFRLTLKIDHLGQACLKVKFPHIEEPFVYEGWVSKANNTMRISVFNPVRQQLQILCNINDHVVDGHVLLDGNILSTDKRGRSVSDSCFVVQKEILEKEGVNNMSAGLVSNTDIEYTLLEKTILPKYLENDLSFKSLHEHFFVRFKSIRHYLKFKKDNY